MNGRCWASRPPPDCEPLDAVGFAHATQGYANAEWSNLRLEFQPRATSRQVSYNLTALWNSLGDPSAERPGLALPNDKACLVWREGERPTFMLSSKEEGEAFAAMLSGATYGEMVLDLARNQPGADRLPTAVAKAGEFLGQWIQEGMIIRAIA